MIIMIDDWLLTYNCAMNEDNDIEEEEIVCEQQKAYSTSAK